MSGKVRPAHNPNQTVHRNGSGLISYLALTSSLDCSSPESRRRWMPPTWRTFQFLDAVQFWVRSANQIFSDTMSHEPEQGIGCLVLAAGEGSRFPGIKQLAPLHGKPLLEYALASALGSKCTRTVVILGAHAEDIQEQSDFEDAETLTCASWKTGMSTSLRAGVRALHDSDALVILLGDQPLIGSCTIDRLVAARNKRCQATRATYSGIPGHPVLIEPELFDRIEELRGDQGARFLLAECETHEVPCEDIANPIDIDTRSDLYRAKLTLISRCGSTRHPQR